MQKRHIHILLYLTTWTLLIFYLPKIMTAIGGNRNSGNSYTNTIMSKDSIDQNAYYSLREVAGVQLGHIVITYGIDETTGRCKAKFQNASCPSPQDSPTEIKKQHHALQIDLHQQIILLESCADTDKSGFVDEEEGARFRDIFEFGHLVIHGLEAENMGMDTWAKATGKTDDEVAEELENYQRLVTGCPREMQKFFPQTKSGSLSKTEGSTAELQTTHQ